MNAMECPKCHAENKENSRFCSNCAAPLGSVGLEQDFPTKTLETPIYVLRPGSLIAGKYRILEEIGQGGMGIVYKAEDLKLKRCVALKFLPPHLMHSPGLKERFLLEAQAAAALSHPHICVIHEVGESGGCPYIAMEYVEGETLRDRIKEGPLKPEEALAFISQVAAGLGDAHHKGIIHRDIKSANIMITGKGQAKVMDFGLAKLRGGSSLTKSQTTLGTVAYMSPEQALGGDLDQRTDIWSLGVVLYEMLTGELPFKGDHDQTVIHSILQREPKAPSKLRPGLSSGLDNIVLRALAKKVSDRYQAMEELREDLEAVAEGLRPFKAKRRMRGRFFGLSRRFILVSALAVALAFILGLNVGGLRERIFGGASGAKERAIKLAVLPFANLSGDSGQEYLSDGLTEEMIAQLGRLHPQSLKVIGRSSVMRYKKGDTPIDQIGRELNVSYVLEGSARRESGRIRISVELVQVQDQTQLWADTYERELSGILALQSEVAKQVAGALALKLLPAEQARLANSRTVNPEAYEAWLKGTQARMSVTKGGFETAERYFNLALEKDPTYAAAWAGIARVWAGRQQMGIVSPSEAYRKAKAAIQKALELDETDWEAHSALAGFLTWSDWEWTAAEREWKRLVELNPNNAEALSRYSNFLMNVGRPAEAIALSERAMELDPFNVKNQGFHALVLLYARRYDDVIAVTRETLRMQPDEWVSLNTLYEALFLAGKHDEALAWDRERYAADGELSEALERGFSEAGYTGARKRMAEVWTARFGKPGGVRAWDLALAWVFAGDREGALQWLERAYQERDPNLPYIGKPTFDSLRSDPRFQDLVRRVGIPAGNK